MARLIINREKIIGKISKDYSMSLYEGIDLINILEKAIKDKMREDVVSEIYIKNFFRLKPNYVYILKNITSHYTKLIRDRLTGKEKETDIVEFEKHFLNAMQNYIIAYEHHRDYKRKPKRKEYFRKFYENFK